MRTVKAASLVGPRPQVVEAWAQVFLPSLLTHSFPCVLALPRVSTKSVGSAPS